jgi:hypothetical protein
MLFSVVVALAFDGDLGPFGAVFTATDFTTWVAGFEIGMGLVAAALLALFVVRIDGDGAAPANGASAIGHLELCPACDADLTDIELDPDEPLPLCPTCDADLTDGLAPTALASTPLGDAGIVAT